MVKVLLPLFFFNCLSSCLLGQQADTGDTLQSTQLEEVVIRAFEQNRRLVDVPGAVNYINQRMLNRFNNTSALNALNATAGVRMEERSPGSYRLNIRGSSLRSPFGVRNVKIYYNNIPFTDPGGNTYLNQLGFYSFGSVEILKGPGSSLYGSGTGGVMLIENNSLSRPKGVNLTYSGGSYGLQNSNVNINTGNDTFRNIINYQHQSANGYREHSRLRRDIFSWEAIGRINKTDKITGSFFYGDLSYQTPGALTLAEYEQNARAARPAAGVSPGAREAGAAIFQKMFLAGISYQKSLHTNWQNTSTLYGAFSKLDNPAIRNYARNNQPHFGGRTVFQFKKNAVNSELTWHTGAEVQHGFTMVKIYRNNQGAPDTLQTDDEININTYFIFSQLTYAVNNWIVTGGLSFNRSKLSFTRFSNSPSTGYSLNFKNQLAPRVALLRKLNNSLSLYTSWSRGFSPPTSEEVFPTGSLSNPDLSAEQGINYELGIKGFALKSRLSFDVSAFYFRVKNSIVQRRDAAGGDFYTNAGSTRQKGIESQVSYQLLRNNVVNRSALIWVSHTFYDFYYKDFKQLNNDFSGNRLPGAAKHNFTAGLDLHSALGFYTNITYQYNDPVPLNDANTAFAEPYNLLGSRIGYKKTYTKINVDLFAGVDNLFDVRYSLGNDINAFGGRYYNAAAGRNYFAGIILGSNY
jgi:iron complex outermembrane receptor protein